MRQRQGRKTEPGVYPASLPYYLPALSQGEGGDQARGRRGDPQATAFRVTPFNTPTGKEWVSV